MQKPLPTRAEITTEIDISQAFRPIQTYQRNTEFR